MPKYLTPDEIGLYRTILSTAAFFAPLPLFGLRSAFIRFFPRKDDKQVTALILIGLGIFLLLFGILAVLAFILKPTLTSFYQENANAINDYLWLILVLIGLMGFYGLLESILKAKKDISTPSFVRETLYKLLQSVTVILVGFSIISLGDFLRFQYYIYLFISFIILFFVLRRVSFNVSKKDIKEANSKEFFTYSRYALLSGLGSIAVLQIDQIMISKYIGLEANAIYTTAIFMAVVIEMPRKYIAQITQPIMVEDFKAKRLDKIHEDYKKASINQLIIGSFIFLGIVINLPSIYALMPNGEIYSAGLSIVYIIGFAKLINMVFSTNGEIIVMSDHYRVNILLIAVLAIMTVALNLVLIPSYGIEGAAYASVLTFLLFNLIKFFYIKAKFNFSPFSKWTLPSIFLIAIVLFINHQFSYLDSPILDIFLRSIGITMIYFLYVIVAKPSRELENIWKVILGKAGFR